MIVLRLLGHGEGAGNGDLGPPSGIGDQEFHVCDFNRAVAPDRPGDARHGVGVTGAVQRRSRIVQIDPAQRGGEPVGIAFAADFAVGNNIDAGLFRDIFVAIGERISDDAWAIRLQYKPLVRWLWLGSLVMAIGGFLAIADKRYRIRVRDEEAVKSGEPAATGKVAEASS